MPANYRKGRDSLPILSLDLASYMEDSNRTKGSIMRNHIERMMAAAAIGALLSQTALAQGPFKGWLTPPTVPTEIIVPAGNTVFLRGSATGTQNYICQSSQSGYFWKFLAPQATLFINYQLGRNEVSQQITTHFLSSNPIEGGTARPTWQSSSDTSIVWGKAVASSIDPAVVAAGAIPWLLLQIVGAQNGPMGGSALSQTTYIHRVNTSGGVAPSTGCSAPQNVGALALVPYTTDYYFYKSTKQ
jgi:uncharacterized protein DUF3455